MPELISVLILAALPAAGNFMGGLLAEAMHISNRTLSLALHAAAGVIMAVVGVELMPEALQAEPAWVVVLAFVAGGGAFILLDHSISLVRTRLTANDPVRHGDDDGEQHNQSGPWAIYTGVAIDLLSDGIMIGAGSSIDLGLGLLLALGQVTADIPEGFATLAALKRTEMPRRTRLLVSLSFAIPVLLGALLGYLFLRGQPDFIKRVLLSFTAGILLTLVVEEIIPESHRDGEARLAALVFVGGFALFTLLSIYLG